MSKGILFFAINNSSINYLKIAYANGLMCRKNLNVPVSVVTSSRSLLANSAIEEKIRSFFDNIFIDDASTGKSNIRRFSNTQYHTIEAPFINENRSSAFNMSPYDETLLIDVDFLIQDSSLSNVWGNVEDFLINEQALNVDHQYLAGEEFRLNSTGIKMVWATCVYFKKTNRVKELFNLIEFIKENWDYYRLLYGFGGYLFRNDFAFAIALHILNGFIEAEEIKKLPVPYILTSTDRDCIFDVEKDAIKILHNDRQLINQNHDHSFYVTKIKNHNVHIMNKLSLQTHLDKLIKIYE